MSGGKSCGSPLRLIRPPNGLRGNSPKLLAGSTHQGISFAIVIGSMAKSLPDAFARWAYCDRPTASRSPRQNAQAERLIGSIRRECLDHVVVFGESHVRHLLPSYMHYYNGARISVSGQGRAHTAGCSGRRTHSADTNSRRIAPSICSDLISDRHTARQGR
jgi:hypothetical protein